MAQRFGIAVSTLHVILERVMTFLLELAPSVIRMPATGEEKDFISTEFMKVLNCVYHNNLSHPVYC